MSETLDTAPPVESAAEAVAPAVTEAPAAGTEASTPSPPGQTEAEAGAVTPAPAAPKEDSGGLSFEEVPPTEIKPAEPPKYEFSLPEGVEAAPEQMAAFTELAGKHLLPPEVAQELLNQHLSVVAETQKQQTEAAEKYWEDFKTEMAAKSAADPEVGPVAARAAMVAGRDVLVPKENSVGFDLMLKTFRGLEQHPEFRRLFVHAGERWKNSQVAHEARNARITPVPQAPTQQQRMESVYPTMFARRA